MSTLQRQVIQSLNGLSDDNLQFLLDMIQRFMRPAEIGEENLSIEMMGRKKAQDRQFRRAKSCRCRL